MTGDDPQEVEDDARIDGMGATPVIVTRWADACTPTAPEPDAAPPVDTERLRRGVVLAVDGLPPASALMVAAADELDARRARDAELVALAAEWRASGEAATENPGLRAVMLARADDLARTLGEQP